MPKHAVTCRGISRLLALITFRFASLLLQTTTCKSFRMASIAFGNGGESEEALPSVAKMHRREVSGRRYHVEIPACDEVDRYTPASQSKAHSSPRRTRSDLPRRNRSKRDDRLDDTFDYGAPNSSKHTSMKSSRGHTVAGERQVGNNDNGATKKNRQSERHDCPRRDTTVKDHRDHRVKQEREQQHDASKKNTSFSSSSTQELDGDRKSGTNTTSSTKRNKKATLVAAAAEIVDDDEPLVPKRHCIWMPFGHARTWSAVLLMGMGVTLAILARRSTSFVKLGIPMELTPQLQPVTDVGLVRLTLCNNDESLQKDVVMPYINAVVDTSDETDTQPIAHFSCYNVRLSTDIVEDTMWEVSRLSASLAIVLGVFFSILLISTVYWESINMKPVAIGLLVTYLLQSFSFFFYDSQLCREHSCKLSSGTYLSIFASFCWFGASMVCILMDVYHTRKMRRLAREERRRRRRLRRAERLKRKASSATSKTEASSGSDLSSEEDVLESPEAVIEENFDEERMAVPV